MMGIALDPGGTIYLAGNTTGSDLTATAGVIGPSYLPLNNSFTAPTTSGCVAALDNSGACQPGLRLGVHEPRFSDGRFQLQLGAHRIRFLRYRCHQSEIKYDLLRCGGALCKEPAQNFLVNRRHP